MNVELYFIKDVNLKSDETNAFIEKIINALSYNPVKVLYKTIVENNKKNLSLAFKETVEAPENIDCIVIVGGLLNDKNCLIKSFFADNNMHLSHGNFSDKAKLIYLEKGVISGYIVNFKGKMVVLLPNLLKYTLRLIAVYVLPYLTGNDRYNVSGDCNKNIIIQKKSNKWVVMFSLLFLAFVLSLIFLWSFISNQIFL